jgi:hypothetical protein
MIPDWLIQLTWFAAGVFATGAFWYFLSNKNYPATLWTGFAALVLALAAVAFHLHNGLMQRPTALDKPQTAATVVYQGASPRPISPRPDASDVAEQQEADIASADNIYSPMTMEEYFDSWHRKATTGLQRDELEAAMLNRGSFGTARSNRLKAAMATLFV